MPKAPANMQAVELRSSELCASVKADGLTWRIVANIISPFLKGRWSKFGLDSDRGFLKDLYGQT
jgi:hypothetical protein